MTTPHYFNERQTALYASLRERYEKSRHLTPADLTYIEVLACILEQIERLQTTINREGSTYASENRDGKTLIKEHPAQRHLAQCRSAANATAARLAKADSEPAGDQLDTFLRENRIELP